MVRRALAPQPQQARRRMPIQERRGSTTSLVKDLPAPTRGWNALDSLNSMHELDAVFIRNWFPTQSTLKVRPGYSEHCDTGTGAEIAQIMPFEYAANAQLLAFSDGGVYNVTSSTPATIATGLTNNHWSYDYLGGYAILANGFDVVKSWDGSSWANPAFTGVTLTDLDHVHAFKSRLYFVQKNTQSMWYGGVGSVAGTLTEFDFSTVAPVRGNLVFTSHLKGDGGDGGANDIFVAVFADGDVLAYNGSDPGTAADWVLVGHYRIGRPLSRFCYSTSDDDIHIATTRGYEKLSETVKFGRTTPERILSSYRIQKEVSSVIKSVGANQDWQIDFYQRGQMMIVSVPLTATTKRQHVRNINTGAWCEFRDINAACWGMLQGSAYFGHGSDGKVYAFDDGTLNDNGAAIRADAMPAWNPMKYRGRNKKVNLIQPFFTSTALPSFSVNAGADYADIQLASFSTGSVSDSTPIWDTSIWDAATWGAGVETFGDWVSRNAIGNMIGFRIAVDQTLAEVEWNNTVVIYDVGGYINL